MLPVGNMGWWGDRLFCTYTCMQTLVHTIAHMGTHTQEMSLGNGAQRVLAGAVYAFMTLFMSLMLVSFVLAVLQYVSVDGGGVGCRATGQV